MQHHGMIFQAHATVETAQERQTKHYGNRQIKGIKTFDLNVGDMGLRRQMRLYMPTLECCPQKTLLFIYCPVCLANYRWIFLPICHQNNWFILVVNTQEKTAAVLDSLDNELRRKKFVVLCQKYPQLRHSVLGLSMETWTEITQLRHSVLGLSVETWTEITQLRHSVLGLHMETWTEIRIACSRQEDSHSCGVFTLMSFPQAARLCKIISQETLSEHCVQAAYRDASEHDNITGWEVFIGGCRVAGVKTLLILAT
ncbi:hypothetical protein LSAT2_014349 [Lamellibrachia satsuma]|nr:hypothetical protein LSAT2_014349 [Lamellibrachia satsuma]